MYTPNPIVRQNVFASRQGVFNVRLVIWLVLLTCGLYLGGLASMPVQAAGPNLLSSDITASKSSLATGEEVTLTVTLRNTGSSSAVAQVTVQMPSEMTYVSGSANEGGEPEGNGVSWSDKSVPASGSVALTFKARLTETVESDKSVLVVAPIMSEGLHFMRWTQITLLSGGSSGSEINLAGSYKYSSQLKLGPDEELTYTIRLSNSGTTAASADVVDSLPADVVYVDKSASDDGVYDPGARTISWSSIDVPAGTEKLLTFVVKGTAVSVPTPVFNKATITAGSQSYTRGALVLLMPEVSSKDHRPPVTNSIQIGDQDVLTNRDVTLHISASDDVGVTQMYIREWHLVTHPLPRWQIVQSSGWIPYQSEKSWTLDAKSGTHFVGVWVADAEFNTSWLNRNAIDSVSLLLSDETVQRGQLVPYLVQYSAGANVTANLMPKDGDADLFVWYPDNFLGPDQASTNPNSETDTINFTAPQTGKYLFEVFGFSPATYNLSITPGGVPRASVVSSNNTKPDLDQEPILNQVGLDPLGDPDVAPVDAPAQASTATLYLPMIFK